MNKLEFVAAIKSVVIKDSIVSVESNLLRPAGRNPDKKIAQLSEWFTKLKAEDRVMTMKVVVESIETCAFGFLCVLDGVRAIEDEKIKGRLILSYEKQGNSVILNDSEEDDLHDLL